MNKYIKHFKTICQHKKYVGKACFKMGISWQGIIHDLSKFSFTEFSIAKYYVGHKSPHQVCREIIGYSPSWIHHYHKNKHHFQYWWDEDEDGKIIPMKMPYKYVIESFCDMVGAGKAYMKDKWDVTQPYKYYMNKCKDKRIMNKQSEYLLVKLLWNMHEAVSEESFYKWYQSAEKYLKDSYNNDGSQY